MAEHRVSSPAGHGKAPSRSAITIFSFGLIVTLREIVLFEPNFFLSRIFLLKLGPLLSFSFPTRPPPTSRNPSTETHPRNLEVQAAAIHPPNRQRHPAMLGIHRGEPSAYTAILTYYLSHRCRQMSGRADVPL